MPVVNMMRSTVDCQSESYVSPLFSRMPRPQWLGIRPNRSCPSGVAYSPQARFTEMLLLKLLMPVVGGTCVLATPPIGAYGNAGFTRVYPVDAVPIAGAVVDGRFPKPPGV